MPKKLVKSNTKIGDESFNIFFMKVSNATVVNKSYHNHVFLQQEARVVEALMKAFGLEGFIKVFIPEFWAFFLSVHGFL